MPATKKQSKRKSSSSSEIKSVRAIVLLLLLVVIISSVVTIAMVTFFPDFSVTTHMKNIFGYQEVPDEIVTLAYDFSVQDEVGFVLDNDILHFGGGPTSARLQRGLNLTTTQDATVHVDWQGPGEVKISENDFYLKAETTKLLTFYIDIPEHLPNGFYEGEFSFSFYR